MTGIYIFSCWFFCTCSDNDGGCKTGRLGFLVFGGVASAVVCLVFIGASFIRMNLKSVEALVLLVLLILWICIAAVASSPRSKLGELFNVALPMAWVGLLISALLLYYVLQHHGTLPFGLGKLFGMGGGAVGNKGDNSRLSNETHESDDHHLSEERRLDDERLGGDGNYMPGSTVVRDVEAPAPVTTTTTTTERIVV